MLQLYIRLRAYLTTHVVPALGILQRRAGDGEQGQTTAEYALVILAAAAVAIVLIAWARSSGKLPAFFDQIIDDITNSAG